MFAIGDILLKVDTRARHIGDFNTQHHAMLVVGINEDDHPIVAHMKFTNFETHTGTLVIEPCPSAKDLILIHCSGLTSKVRDEVVLLAKRAEEGGKLQLNKEFLEHEYNLANPYRGRDWFENQKILPVLQRIAFKPTDILSKSSLLISCHDFVLSTINFACCIHEESLPKGLAIPPNLAWSDILYTSVLADEAISVKVLNRLTRGGSRRDSSDSSSASSREGSPSRKSHAFFQPAPQESEANTYELIHMCTIV